MPRKVLPRRFYARDARVVAPELLNKVIVHGKRSARIVEVEAYVGSEDPGSHAYRGATPRTSVMFGAAGHLYVYFTYGMHWCANAVCGKTGEGMAVLLRAGAPLTDLDAMYESRPAARRVRDLCSGPGKLCQALGIGREHNGADLVRGAVSGVRIADDGTPPPAVPSVSTRVGLSAGTDLPWRWYVPDEPNVSKARLTGEGSAIY